jgi:hypothetical protein
LVVVKGGLMPLNSTTISNFDELFGHVQEQYMPAVFSEIRRQVEESVGEEAATYQDIFRAFEDRISPRRLQEVYKRSTISGIGAFIDRNMFLLTAVLLTITFGILGLSGGAGGRLSVDQGKSFLDVAKIFAGAIVGGAATTVVGGAAAKKIKAGAS